ncbi:CCA tRNA nucleotidyltransferase [Candidatus Stoquefichus massiliensis]|uniref:CCA tRNA nucleotidyltransferase n=1 Tax=Candidatus Stoquefichus massiliensis TaxID=1470350 RepID=UPI00048A0CB8|nr:HD domain-containing protein [Candidatus Stoquefichus massiliensis]
MEICSLAKSVFNDISNAGGYVYIVGGSVRDDILNIHTEHDIDVEVYHLSYQQLYDVLSKHGTVNTFGQSFAIMQLSILPHYDFALPRKEKKSGEKHQDFDIIIDPDLPIEKAILRRDLTMNALMYDYHQDKIIDLCGGMNDIKEKVIRCVSLQTFGEDPLRVLRIAQFAARFDMSIDLETKQLCYQMVKDGMLDHLSKERIYEEYCKILMSPKPSIGFYFLKEIKALPSFLENLTMTHQRLDYHPEGDVFTHTMLVIDVAALCKQKTDQPLSFMWSCLLHDIGKPLVTTSEGHAPGHNESGVDIFKQVDLITSKKQRQYIQTMIMYHMHLMNMARNHSRDISYLRLLKKIEGKVSLNDLIYISCCDKLGRGKVVQSQYNDFLEFIRDKKERLGEKAPLAIINGYDLIGAGWTEEKIFKDVLEEAYDLQLQGLNREKILRSLKKKYDKR